MARPSRPPRAGAGSSPAGSARPAGLRPEGPDWVLLGEFGRAQGLRGEVRLKSYTASPEDIAGYGPLTAADGRRFTLTAVRPAGGAPDLLVVRVEGVADRTGAEALNRLALHVPRAALGAPEPDEFFAADLVGLAVVDGAGAAVGTVVAVPNYGGGDLLEIRPAQGGATALLPFLTRFVPTVDLAGGRLVVDAPDDLFAPARREPEEPEG